MKIEAADRGPHQGLACRLVLFDLDGTLVDSTPGIRSSVRAAAAALGLPEPTPEQLRGMVGPPLQDGFALVLGVPADDVPRAVAAYRAHHAAGALLDATVYPGVPEPVAALVGAGWALRRRASRPTPARRGWRRHPRRSGRHFGRSADGAYGAVQDLRR